MPALVKGEQGQEAEGVRPPGSPSPVRCWWPAGAKKESRRCSRARRLLWEKWATPKEVKNKICWVGFIGLR
jgi:hypothetical protein